MNNLGNEEKVKVSVEDSVKVEIVEGKKKSGLATAGLVLGIIGVCTSFMPLINNLSFVMGVLSVVFGLIAILKRASKGKAVASLILGVLAIVFTLQAQASLSKAMDEAFSTFEEDMNAAFEEFDNSMNTISGGKTDEILANSLDVAIGEFQVTDGEYWDETKLEVKLTNKGNEKSSFSVKVEAVTSSGDRINTDYIYANDLNAGQSQTFDIFTFVASDDIDAMKNAEFKVLEVSMY